MLYFQCTKSRDLIDHLALVGDATPLDTARLWSQPLASRTLFAALYAVGSTRNAFSPFFMVKSHHFQCTKCSDLLDEVTAFHAATPLDTNGA